MSAENPDSTERFPIANETLPLYEGPVHIALGGDELLIGHSERDFGIFTPSEYCIYQPETHAKDSYRGYIELWEDIEVVLGRSREVNGDRFDFSESVSRYHASFILRNFRFGHVVEVQDRDSSNGTYEITSGRPVAAAEQIELLHPAADSPETKNQVERFKAVAASEASPRHPDYNEDAYLIASELGLIGVFDGVGGAENSAVTSHQAAYNIHEYHLRNGGMRMSKNLARLVMRESLEAAHSSILKRAVDSRRALGTTATVAKVFEDHMTGLPYAAIASAGDSRAYLFRSETLEILTLDHAFLGRQNRTPSEQMAIQSTLAEITTLSNMDEDERALFRNRNLLTSYLGIPEGSPSIALTEQNLEAGDRILLTTDGIHDNLTTSEIEQVLRVSNDESTAVQQLVQQAKSRSLEVGHARKKRDDMTAAMLAYL